MQNGLASRGVCLRAWWSLMFHQPPVSIAVVPPRSTAGMGSFSVDRAPACAAVITTEQVIDGTELLRWCPVPPIFMRRLRRCLCVAQSHPPLPRWRGRPCWCPDASTAHPQCSHLFVGIAISKEKNFLAAQRTSSHSSQFFIVYIFSVIVYILYFWNLFPKILLTVLLWYRHCRQVSSLLKSESAASAAAPQSQSVFTVASPGQTSTKGLVGCDTLARGGATVFYQQIPWKFMCVMMTYVLIHDSVSAGAAFESLPFDFWATVAEMFSVTDDSPLVCRWGRFNSLNENASGVHALMHICGKCGVQMCCSDIHFISWDISTTSLLLSTHSHTNTRMQTLRHASTNHPHSPLVESRKCGSVKVTGYLGWLSFPNSLSISRLQFHCCGCPHCLACCLISESHPTTLQATRHRETNKKN